MIDRCFHGKYTTVIPLRGEVVTSKADKNIERLLLTVRGEGRAFEKKDYGRDMLIDPC